MSKKVKDWFDIIRFTIMLIVTLPFVIVICALIQIWMITSWIFASILLWEFQENPLKVARRVFEGLFDNW